MPDVPEIIQEIGIQGQEDILGAFKSIAAAGKEVFDKLGDVAGHNPFGELFKGVGELVAALSAATLAVGAFALESAKSIKELGELSNQFGGTVEDASAMTSAFAAMGASTDGLANSFKRMAVRLESEWPTIAQSVRNSSEQIIEEQLKVAESANKLGLAQIDMANSAAKAAHQVQEDYFAVEGATQSVTAAQYKLNTLLGNPPTKYQKEQLAIEEARLALAKAEEAQAQAARKQDEDAAKAKRQSALEDLQFQKEELALNQEKQKQQEAAYKSIPAVADALKLLKVAGQDLTKVFDLSMVSVQDLGKAIILNAGRAAAAAKGIAGQIKPTDKDILFEMADAFQHIEDNTTKTAIAFRTLGRGVSQDVIEALSKGRRYFIEYENELKKVGLVIDEVATKDAEELVRSFNRLSSDASITSQQLGNLFSPAFTEGFKVLDEAIRENHESIIAFGKDVAGTLKPIIEDFFNILAGKQVKTGWIEGLVGFFSILKTAVQGVVAGFGFLADITQKVAEAFGVTLTHGEALATVLLALAAVFGPEVVAIGLLITALGRLWEAMGGWEGVKAGLQSFADWVMTTWVGTLVRGIQSVVGWLQKLYSTKPSSDSGGALDSTNGLAGVATSGGFASGGLVLGRGSGTSDSNLVKVSRGEYVVRAAAVENLGVHMMDAINNMSFPKFAEGGLVRAPIKTATPASNTGSTINLSIDGHRFGGMHASDDVAGRLRSYAIGRQVSSAGVRPSWYK